MHQDKLHALYLMQMSFQTRVLELEGVDRAILPADDSERFMYHTTALVEEMGEILKADKRWKTHRNTTYDRSEKLDEYADLFVTVMNIGIFSGFNTTEIVNAIESKIIKNNKRLSGDK